jgi:DnaJ family protein A protein 2
VKQISKEGMPTYKRPYEKGHLYVHFEITFPASHWTSDPEHFKALESVLPARALPTTLITDDAEEVVLVEPDQSRRAQGGPSAGGRERNGQAYQEDDDDEGPPGMGGHPGVQCAQQ